MQRRLLQILACPTCHSDLSLDGDALEIEEGLLRCTRCQNEYPIHRGIPRFVPRGTYADSFGLQWNHFRAEQLDSNNGTTLSRDRWFNETRWSAESVSSSWVLDAGCGAGRFLDVSSQVCGDVVGLDLSNAVDAAAESLKDRKNVHLVQASLFELPFKSGAFDACYCIGVIQHTPDPHRAVAALPRVLRSGGRLALTIYEKKWTTPLYSKYWVRPLTRRLPASTLLKGLEASMPVLFPLTDKLFRLPMVGKVFQFAIPVANYVEESQLSKEQRYAWALLDTFDMLAPAYDNPQTYQEVQEVLSGVGVTQLQRIQTGGLTVLGVKSETRENS
jgi:ubiquinone/menaquinone biosynthesis C-methylase UbiE/uncharacterized protein YbaR (Trm112 family)